MRKGFTLIELLVVIAIIGILSAVILASLYTAKSKAGDAAIQSDLHTMQTQAEIYYSDPSGGNNSYGTPAANCKGANLTVMFHVPPFSNAIAGMNAAGSTVYCNSTGTAYMVQASLISNPNTYWCVDSNGHSGVENAAVVSGAIACL